MTIPPPMTTSPESRAKEIVSRALAVDAAVNLGTDYLESLIASAIREAENAIIDHFLAEIPGSVSPQWVIEIIEARRHKD